MGIARGVPYRSRQEMARKSPPGATDAKLLEQLEAARTRDEPVEAIVSLQPDDESEVVSADRVDQISRDVVERVTRKTGVSPTRINVFRNLGSFAVAAAPSFVSELLAQPEVKAATANRRDSPVVEPLGRPSPEDNE